jgi:hypothetical protein
MKVNNALQVVEALAFSFANIKTAMVEAFDSSDDEEGHSDNDDDVDDHDDHRGHCRRIRTKYDHADCKRTLYRDFLGPEPKVKFHTVFRISKERFMAIHDDIRESQNRFFFNKHGKGASPEARLLLPLQCLAFGLAPHAIAHNYAMSRVLARQCCVEFDKSMSELYVNKYIRKPSTDDLKNITNLHNEIHGVPGMYGSLDCMHHAWKNCPTAWKGSYQGKAGKPTIILESVCDYNLWFWNSFYGCAGSFNDLNVLKMSNLMTMFLDGTFDAIEREAGVVPYKISDSEFDALFLLVDGIYPKYSRFVKGIKDPINEQECAYTGWQEAARKDIERAFGVLQCQWQFMRKPVELLDLELVTMRVKSCLILHNMGVSDRVMDGDVTAVYNPTNILLLEGAAEGVRNKSDGGSLSTATNDGHSTDVVLPETGGVYDSPIAPPTNRKRGRSVSPVDDGENPIAIDGSMDRTVRWGKLSDPVEHIRLRTALMKKYEGLG